MPGCLHDRGVHGPAWAAARRTGAAGRPRPVEHAREDLAGGAHGGREGHYVARSELRDGSLGHRLQAEAPADLLGHLAAQPLPDRWPHELQRLADPFVGDDVEKRGLAELDGQSPDGRCRRAPPRPSIPMRPTPSSSRIRWWEIGVPIMDPPALVSRGRETPDQSRSAAPGGVALARRGGSLGSQPGIMSRMRQGDASPRCPCTGDGSRGPCPRETPCAARRTGAANGPEAPTSRGPTEADGAPAERGPAPTADTPPQNVPVGLRSGRRSDESELCGATPARPSGPG